MHLHYRTYGQGPPLIILHGLFGSLDNWHRVSELLGAHFHVFAVDQRNHGQSSHAPQMDYITMAEDLENFCRVQSPAHVLGHSMGGKTAMQFASMYPDLVKRLVVVDIAPKPYPPVHQQILDALLSLDLSAYKTRTEIERALEPQIPDLTLRRFLLKNLLLLPDGSFKWKMNLPAINNSYPELNRELNWSRPVEIPTLFVKGKKSDYILEQDLPLIRKLFKNAEITTVEAVGHWVHAEAPETFVRILLDFLTRP